MCVCVCVCVCLCVCLRARVSACVHVCERACVRPCVYVTYMSHYTAYWTFACRYNKPVKCLEPHPIRDSAIITVDRDSSDFKTAESSDLALDVSWKTVADLPSIPSWSGSNAFLSEQNMPVATTC